MRDNDFRTRHPRASDAWRYPGMDSSGNRLEENTRRHWRHNGDSFRDDRRGREYDDRGYYHDPSGYPDDRGGFDRNESRYYDSDIYEQEFDDRMNWREDDDRYEGTNWGNAGRQSAYGNFRPREEMYDGGGHDDDRYDDHRHHRNMFERAGERLREIWNDWRGRDERDGLLHERFREDRNERRYGSDNWAPNANRGYGGTRSRRYRDYSY
jgi:hypothetical protein